MQLLIVLAAFCASLLTLISGFGLGTLLLPVLALFFPLPVAVGLTAVVHLLNNAFKTSMLWHEVDVTMMLRFGIPSILGALVGALVLDQLGDLTPLYMGIRVAVGPLAIALAALMVLFAITELSPRISGFSFNGRHLFAGGLVSGFFGGLSGHQGALRSMFLLRSGMRKEAYIATGVAVAMLVDLTRIPLYLRHLGAGQLEREWLLLVACVLAAFLGAWWGKQLIPKITYRTVQLTVGGLMIGIASMLVAGII
ncbi:MAG: sulfite exporter TauE/SafE family protein [Flavobacteriales bacterium]|nr:sulfite exporter TauE/SafE family protein [Flavobacteriales bacterium]